MLYELAELYRRYYETVRRDQEKCDHSEVKDGICFLCNKVLNDNSN